MNDEYEGNSFGIVDSLVKCSNQWDISEQGFYFYNILFFTPPFANGDRI
jgi:hypothetical protein